MAAFDEFERRMWELINQGCSVDKAYDETLKEYRNLADSADKLLEIKQKIEWKVKMG